MDFSVRPAPNQVGGRRDVGREVILHEHLAGRKSEEIGSGDNRSTLRVSPAVGHERSRLRGQRRLPAWGKGLFFQGGAMVMQTEKFEEF
ncbi:MAG TPA: hypothetical protein VE083_09060 [Terriglobales bacterium]|nr:hypothetical protein [Terriglobales bacterium]